MAAAVGLSRFGVGARHLRDHPLGDPARGGAARAAARAVAALAQPRAPERWPRGARDARRPLRRSDRGRAACATSRGVARLIPTTGAITRRAPRSTCRLHPRHPRLPEARDRLQGRHAAPRGCRRRCTRPSSSSRRGPSPRRPDVILGAEARGFVLGAALAYRLGIGFVAARKPGKLPHTTISAKYALEYGGRLARGARSTRSRAARACSCTTTCSPPAAPRARSASSSSSSAASSSAAAFLIELAFLGGRARLAPHEVFALVGYDSE